MWRPFAMVRPSHTVIEVGGSRKQIGSFEAHANLRTVVWTPEYWHLSMMVEYHDTTELKALEQTKQKKAFSDRKLVRSSDL